MFLIDSQLFYRLESVFTEGDGASDDFNGTTLRAEYTLNRAIEKIDLIFTGEYHFNEKQINSSIVSLNNYLSVGTLVSANDKYLSTYRISGSALLDDPSQYFLSLEAEIGLSDYLRMGVIYFYAGQETAMTS